MAFRIIREFTEKPSLLITCDHPNGCASYDSTNVESGDEMKEQVQIGFCQALGARGWKLGLSHRCPQHHVIDKASEKRIIVASGPVRLVS